MSAPTRPRRAQVTADCVQLLRAEVYTAAGHSLDDMGLADLVEWVILVGGRLEHFTVDDMTPEQAVAWARGATGATLVESNTRDDRGYWIGTLPAPDPPPREPAAAIDPTPPAPEPEPAQPATKRSWRKRKPEPEPEASEDDASTVEAEPRPTLTDRLDTARWPRFMTEQPPSFVMAVDYARRGGWSQHPEDTPARSWHVGWAYAMTPVLALSTWLGWACMRPGRLLPSLGALALGVLAIGQLVGWWAL